MIFHVSVEVMDTNILQADLTIGISNAVLHAFIYVSSQVTWHIVHPDHFEALSTPSVFPINMSYF